MIAPIALVPVAPLTHGERLAAEFAGKQVLLMPLIAEPALRVQVALKSLRGTKQAHYKAAAMYSLPMLRALTAQHGPPTDAHFTYWAAAGGNLACLQYLHERGCPWNKWTTRAAAEGGHLTCLQYLHEAGCPWDAEATCAAALGGHLACLQYLHENNCPWGVGTTAGAASGGHLACLQYIHEAGHPWHVATAYTAASGGHLACLQYADEHGCPWTSRLVKKCATGNCVEYCKSRAERQSAAAPLPLAPSPNV
jgi:hypothetical protein